MKLLGYEQIPPNTQFLILHGEKDEIVPFASGMKLLQVIPRARFVKIGSQPGEVPNFAFGHRWWEYFEIEVWVDVVETFLASGPNQRLSRL